jgi:hypothetical protein
MTSNTAARLDDPMGGNAGVAIDTLDCKKRCSSVVTIKTKAHEMSQSSSGTSLKTPVLASRDTRGH